MQRKKQKKPSKKMRPSAKKVLGRLISRFQLSTEDVVKAKAAGLTAAILDEVATGRKIKRRANDKLPSRPASPSQIKRVKAKIGEGYAAFLASASPPPPAASEPSRSQKAREAQLAERGMAKLTVTLPAVLRSHVMVECARAGLKLDEAVQTALEAQFPMSSPVPPSPAGAA